MNAVLAKPIRMIWFITAGGPDLDQLFFRGASGWFAASDCATIGHGALAALHNRKIRKIISVQRPLRSAQTVPFGMHQRRFGETFDIAGDETMRGEIDDAVIGERRALERGLAGVLAEMNVGSRNAEVCRNRCRRR
jgi:hypothetical protein